MVHLYCLMLLYGNLWWWHFTFEITAELIFCSKAFLGPMQGGCVQRDVILGFDCLQYFYIKLYLDIIF
jgi:hypothetical protein